MNVDDRFGAEVADAGLDRDAAVGPDDEQAVEPDRAGENALTATPTPRTFVPLRLPLRAFAPST